MELVPIGLNDVALRCAKRLSGTMYSGQWVEGVRSGYGCELTGDGDLYVGQWHNDSMHGYVSMHRLPRLSSLVSTLVSLVSHFPPSC